MSVLPRNPKTSSTSSTCRQESHIAYGDSDSPSVTDDNSPILDLDLNGLKFLISKELVDSVWSVTDPCQSTVNRL